jgi:ATP-dependent helicase/nuclease subunit A
MLIVTFTRKAAGELKGRITKALSEALSADRSNTHLSRQLTAVGSARICTIDSYYKSIVDANFQRLGISSTFRLADESELAPLRLSIMNATIERAYSLYDDFGAFCDELTTAKTDSRLAKELLDIAKKINAMPDGIDYLEKCADLYEQEVNFPFFESRAGRSMLRSAKEELTEVLARAKRALELIDQHPENEPRRASLEIDCRCGEAVLDALNDADYTRARESLAAYSPKRLGNAKENNEISQAIKGERDLIKSCLTKYKDKFFTLSEETISILQGKSAWFCRMLKKLLEDFHAAYAEEKRSLSVCEFSDLRHFVRSLLIDAKGKPTSLAAEERKKFTHIFVDEYQDTDRIQDEIFRAISNGKNLFLVGDIKQSIYSFRQAEPAVFAAYRTEFPIYNENADAKNATSSSIFMSENFRCSESIIDFTNAVCSYIFQESEKGAEGVGIGYMPEDDLRFSRGAGAKLPVRIVTTETQDKSHEDENGDSSGIEREIAFVVSEIKKLISSGYLPGGKKVVPGDIAVLARSNATCTKMAEALAREGIRYANSVGSDLFENHEVLLMISLLSACDNPRRDLALAGALRSPIFNFSLSDLVNIRMGRKEMSLYDSMLEFAKEEPEHELSRRCAKASERLEKYRSEAEAMPVHRFIRYLWQDTNALIYAGSDPESRKRTPAERRRNLQQLYEYARRYEASAFRTLHDFVEYIHGIIENDTEVSSEDITDEGTVNIMSVHKSKGLEFPVVFLINTSSSPSHRDSSPSVIFTTDDDIGLAAKLSDPTGLGIFETPMRLAAASRLDGKSAEESIRILYVALTRARDMLYITASGGKAFLSTLEAESARKAASGGRIAVLEKRSWFAWIMLALKAGKGLGSYTIEEFVPQSEESEQQEQEVTIALDQTEVKAAQDELCRRFSFEYPHRALSAIPAKMSVSRLYPEALDNTENEEELLRKVEEYEPRTPRFMGGQSNAAERGTATHLFMQFCDFERLDGSEESAKEEANRLLASGFIPRDAAEIIRYREVAAFAQSALFRKIKSAQRIYREQRFNIFLDAKNFTSSPELAVEIDGEKLLVQGVIDLFFIDEDEKLVLCDYKTDRLTPEELKDAALAQKTLSDRHGEQLGYYAMALERIVGRRPDRVCIFSLHAGREFDII